MSEIPTEHLVKYYLPPRKRGGDPRVVNINTYQLLGVRWAPARRGYRDVLINQRLAKIWKKKHPTLSLFFTPFRFWTDGWDFTYFQPAKIEISYGDTKAVLEMSDNKTAERVCQEMRDTFWKKDA